VRNSSRDCDRLAPDAEDLEIIFQILLTVPFREVERERKMAKPRKSMPRRPSQTAGLSLAGPLFPSKVVGFSSVSKIYNNQEAFLLAGIYADRLFLLLYSMQQVDKVLAIGCLKMAVQYICRMTAQQPI
jgi:hypothetical protein